MMLEVRNLTVTYDAHGAANEAVKNVSFAVAENSFCGMTLLGLLPAGAEARGEILYKGRNILGLPESELAALRQREIALVPQGALNSFTPVMTIGRHIKEVLEVHLGLRGEEAERRAAELLGEVELSLPARAFRRAEAARRDSARFVVRAESGARRRTYDGARRDNAGGDSAPSRKTAPREKPYDTARNARPADGGLGLFGTFRDEGRAADRERRAARFDTRAEGRAHEGAHRRDALRDEK